MESNRYTCILECTVRLYVLNLYTMYSAKKQSQRVQFSLQLHVFVHAKIHDVFKLYRRGKHQASIAGNTNGEIPLNDYTVSRETGIMYVYIQYMLITYRIAGYICVDLIFAHTHVREN